MKVEGFDEGRTLDSSNRLRRQLIVVSRRLVVSVGGLDPRSDLGDGGMGVRRENPKGDLDPRSSSDDGKNI